MEPLETIAEVGVAFAGFASIVSVLGVQNKSKIPIFYRISVRGMLLCSLTTVVASLMPFVVSNLIRDIEQSWFISALILTFGLIALNLAAYRDGRAIKDLAPFVARAVGGIPLNAALVLAALAALNYPHGYAGPLYIGALWLVLVVSAYLFGGIVLVLIDRPNREREHDD